LARRKGKVWVKGVLRKFHGHVPSGKKKKIRWSRFYGIAPPTLSHTGSKNFTSIL